MGGPYCQPPGVHAYRSWSCRRRSGPATPAPCECQFPPAINASQMNDNGYVRKRAWQYLPPELSRRVRSISLLIFFSTVSAQPSRPTDAQWLRRWPTGLAVVAINRGGNAEVNDPGVRLPDSNAGAGLRCRASFTTRPRPAHSNKHTSDADD